MTTTAPTEEPKAEVYRARFGLKTSAGCSSGDWRYYESRTQLEDDLLAAQLDVLIEHDGRNVTRSIARRRRVWRRFLEDEDYPRVTNIVGIDRFEDGRWIPLAVEFHEPTVTITDAEA